MRWPKSSTSLPALLGLLAVSLPLVNPWVRGDGVGYYAYVRALLVEHKLDFQNDWRAGNTSFTMGLRVRSKRGGAGLAAEGIAVIVMLDYRTGARVPLSAALRDAIEKLEASAPDPGQADEPWRS